MSNFDEPVHFKEGQVIFVEGEKPAYLYIIVSGEVRVFKEDGNTLLPINLLKSKDFIGELSMFDDHPRSATALASKDSEIMLVKRTDIRKVLKDCPEWVSNIMMTISDRLRDTIDMMRDHRIIDDFQDHGGELDPQELKKYMSSIKEYRARRGLN